MHGEHVCIAMASTYPRSAMAMTTSSREALPARSPMPLMVHSTWRAPFMAPARLLAVDSPRSFWQWVEMMTLSMPGVLALMSAIRLPNSCGRFQPVVSGMLRVVAPAYGKMWELAQACGQA